MCSVNTYIRRFNKFSKLSRVPWYYYQVPRGSKKVVLVYIRLLFIYVPQPAPFESNLFVVIIFYYDYHGTFVCRPLGFTSP
jgi:hypothetical protein